jgi:hypothetical protein
LAFPTDDRWIAENSVLISARRLHALGVVTLYWNACEGSFLDLFGLVSKLGAHAKWIVTKDQGTKTLIEMMIRFAEENIKEKTSIEEIKHACKILDIYRENRNCLTHFVFTNNSRSLYFAKRSKTRPGHTNFHHSVPAIRRVANELRELDRYLQSVALYVYFREVPPRNPAEPKPSLKRPALPKLLQTPPHVPRAQKRLPRSSAP